MLNHLRRSVILAALSVVIFTFAYAYVGTGVSQLFFRGQADGSITPNGSTLIGQNWADTTCPELTRWAVACSRDAPTTSAPTRAAKRTLRGTRGTTRSRPTGCPGNRGQPTSGHAQPSW